MKIITVRVQSHQQSKSLHRTGSDRKENPAMPGYVQLRRIWSHWILASRLHGRRQPVGRPGDQWWIRQRSRRVRRCSTFADVCSRNKINGYENTIYFILLHNIIFDNSVCHPLWSAARGDCPVAPYHYATRCPRIHGYTWLHMVCRDVMCPPIFRLRNAIFLELNLNIRITVIRHMSTKTCGISYRKMSWIVSVCPFKLTKIAGVFVRSGVTSILYLSDQWTRNQNISGIFLPKITKIGHRLTNCYGWQQKVLFLTHSVFTIVKKIRYNL